MKNLCQTCYRHYSECPQCILLATRIRIHLTIIILIILANWLLVNPAIAETYTPSEPKIIKDYLPTLISEPTDVLLHFVSRHTTDKVIIQKGIKCQKGFVKLHEVEPIGTTIIVKRITICDGG